MARTESKMVEIGSEATEFTLYSPKDERFITLTSQKSSKANLIIFMCNHCPFVKHINESLSQFAKEYMPKGLSIIAINPNDAENYPEDSPEKMIELADKFNFDFPYLYDETQDVAKVYGAECTPDFFLYDGDLKLQYRGQYDDSRPGNDLPVTGIDLKNAVDKLLNNELPNSEQKPSVGCGIKWRNH
jgi:thiol-disulfide isomerase/thioredoxin